MDTQLHAPRSMPPLQLAATDLLACGRLISDSPHGSISNSVSRTQCAIQSSAERILQLQPYDLDVAPTEHYVLCSKIEHLDEQNTDSSHHDRRPAGDKSREDTVSIPLRPALTHHHTQARFKLSYASTRTVPHRVYATVQDSHDQTSIDPRTERPRQSTSSQQARTISPFKQRPSSTDLDSDMAQSPAVATPARRTSAFCDQDIPPEPPDEHSNTVAIIKHCQAQATHEDAELHVKRMESWQSDQLSDHQLPSERTARINGLLTRADGVLGLKRDQCYETTSNIATKARSRSASTPPQWPDKSAGIFRKCAPGDHTRNDTFHPESSFGDSNTSRRSGKRRRIEDDNNNGNEDNGNPSQGPPDYAPGEPPNEAVEPRFSCVFRGLTHVQHMPACDTKRRHMSQLSRHHHRHDFFPCHRCFEPFANSEAQKDHVRGRTCGLYCLAQDCPNFESIGQCRHDNSQLAIWTKLHQMARAISVQPHSDEVFQPDQLDVTSHAGAGLLVPPFSRPHPLTRSISAQPDLGSQLRQHRLYGLSRAHAYGRPPEAPQPPPTPLIAVALEILGLARTVGTTPYFMGGGDARCVEFVTMSLEAIRAQMQRIATHCNINTQLQQIDELSLPAGTEMGDPSLAPETAFPAQPMATDTTMYQGYDSGDGFLNIEQSLVDGHGHGPVHHQMRNNPFAGPSGLNNQRGNIQGSGWYAGP